MGAELLDSLVLVALIFGLGWALGFPSGFWLEDGSTLGIPTRDDLPFGFLSLVATLVYYVPVMTLTNGQTLGKWVAGIRVVRADLEPMTAGVAALREGALKTVVSFVVLPAYVLNVLWPLWDRERRALHYLAARTRVVRDGRVRAEYDDPSPLFP